MPIEQFPAVFLFRFAATAEKRPAAASGIASNNPILFIADLFRGLYSCLCVFAVPSSKIEKTPKLYKYDSPDSEYQSAFMRRDSESGRTISQRKGAGKAGLLLRTGMRTTVVRVRCKHRMRHLAVGNKLNRAVVIAELLLGDDVRIVPVDITIHTTIFRTTLVIVPRSCEIITIAIRPCNSASIR